MSLADVHGRAVHYTSAGSGAPVLMLMPLSTGPQGRGALVEGLADTFRVVAFDQRGTGGSAPAPGPVSIEGLADDALGLLDALGVQRTHLLCHSTGCGVGQSLAARHPERVGRLVLAAPWTHADRHLTEMQTLRKAAARVLEPELHARLNAALLFPPDYRRAQAEGFERLASAAPLRPQDADDIGRRLDAILAFDARPLWPAIRCPVLVLVASDDQLMPAWFAAQTAAALAEARLVTFDGGGHMLTETRAEACVRAIAAFLGEDGAGA